MKRFLTALPAVLLLAGCAGPGIRPGTRPPSPAPGMTATERPTTPPPPTCPATGVRMEFGAGDAAMGLRLIGLQLINCGQRPYTVEGYPEVDVLGDAGEVLDIRILRGIEDITGTIPDLTAPPEKITLQPGESASAPVAWRNKYDDIRHPPVLAPALKVAPQPGRPAEVVALEGGFDLGNTGRLGVGPWLVPKNPEISGREGESEGAEGESAENDGTPTRPEGSRAPVPTTTLQPLP